MNFALLGFDPDVTFLLRGIASDPVHRLTHFWRPSSIPEADAPAPAAARRVDDWAELLSGESLDAIIVAGGGESVTVAAKQLYAAGRSLLVVPHPKQETAWLYELSLLQEDAPGALLPAFPRRLYPPVRRLREAIAAGRLGRLMFLELERRIPAAGEGPALLSQEQVDRSLLPDVDLLRYLAGDHDRVTALWTGRSEQGIAGALVTLAGENVPEATWSLRPVPSKPGWKLTVSGEAGKGILSGEEDPQTWRLTFEGAVQEESEGERRTVESESVELDAVRELLEHVETVVRGDTAYGRSAPPLSAPRFPTWDDLIRAAETVDAAHDSVRRRRTIDLHFGTHSEQSVFKTQMTAVGCGVLVLTLLAVLLLLLFDAAFDIPPLLRRILRAIVFLPLFLYLLLQLLYFAARPAGTERSSAE